MPISRRHALMALGTVVAAPALSASAEAPQGQRFEHGVASGDPLGDRVILWTRLSGLDGAADVTWQVAHDEAFQRVVSRGTARTDAGRDYTVKVDAAGLKPGQHYYYRFISGDAVSPVGRTQTLPETSERLVLAVASCSLHPGGYFNAYRAIADLPELDAVLHLGDYIYEYGAGLDDFGMGNGRVLLRIPEPQHEIVTLDDYRTRHAQYKRDEDLQAAHARAPWICVFDDHEICNNPWRDGAQNHNPERGEGTWADRKASALKAYREWMPIRDPQGVLSEAIYRSFRFGDLAELIMLESRLLARSRQLDYETDLVVTDGKPDTAAFREKLNDPARELLGAGQRAWLGQTLDASVAAGVRWQVFGNQVLMAKMNGPDLVRVFGANRIDSVLDVLPDAARDKATTFIDLFSGADPLPWNLDAWDGYPAERERLYDMVKASGARAVVLSGDSHSAWANQLHDASGATVAAEIGVTAISSPTRWLDKWLPDLGLAKTFADQNAEVLAADDAYNGFVRLTLTPGEMTAEWMMVTSLMSRDFTCFPLRRFSAEAGNGAPILKA